MWAADDPVRLLPLGSKVEVLGLKKKKGEVGTKGGENVRYTEMFPAFVTAKNIPNQIL